MKRNRFEEKFRQYLTGMTEKFELLGADGLSALFGENRETFLDAIEKGKDVLLFDEDDGPFDYADYALPILICIGVGFCEFFELYDGPRKDGEEISRAIRRNVGLAHEWLQDLIGAEPQKFGMTHLTREALRIAARDGKWMAEYLEESDEWAPVEGLVGHFDSCLKLVALSMSEVPKEEKYIEEMPRKRCRSCHRESVPCIRPGSAPKPGAGWEFVCQFCGHPFGYGGKRKRMLNAEGRRVNGSHWTPRRLHIDHCQLCFMEGSELREFGGILQIHHIVPVRSGGRDVPTNILVLCENCHKEVHRKQKGRH